MIDNKIKTFQEAKKYIDRFIKYVDYENFNPKKRTVNPLERMKYFLSLLGNPQRKFPSIVVSGTSGKGSTTIMIADMLVKSGYKTGMTISPHLQSITERFMINNKNIHEFKFINLLSEIIPAIHKVKESRFGSPSYFEIILGMVFMYFASEEIDIAVVEVGLEGKFDGTNVLEPFIFVLTNISLDHTNILGNTLEKIAEEATDRINNKMIVITGVTQKSVVDIVFNHSKNVFLLRRDFDYKIKKKGIGKIIFDFKNSFLIKDINLSLTGEYQVENASLAIASVKYLRKYGFFVSKEVIKKTLSEISIPGRFEIFHKKTNLPIILDGAHNPAKMKAFINSLKINYSNNNKIFVVSFSRGHNLTKMIKQIKNIADVIIITKYNTVTDMGINRTEKISDIFNQLENHNLKFNRKKKIIISTAENVKEAIKKGVIIAEKEKIKSNILVATGSLYLVGELRELLLTEHF